MNVRAQFQSPWVLLAYWLGFFLFAVGAWFLAIWLAARAL